MVSVCARGKLIIRVLGQSGIFHWHMRAAPPLTAPPPTPPPVSRELFFSEKIEGWEKGLSAVRARVL
jgi:hypothetical protein